MRVLLIGLGSMGKRRMRNLQHLKAGEIVGCDPRADRRQEVAERYGIKAVPEMPDYRQFGAIVISTPPSLSGKS